MKNKLKSLTEKTKYHTSVGTGEFSTIILSTKYISVTTIICTNALYHLYKIYNSALIMAAGKIKI